MEGVPHGRWGVEAKGPGEMGGMGWGNAALPPLPPLPLPPLLLPPLLPLLLVAGALVHVSPPPPPSRSNKPGAHHVPVAPSKAAAGGRCPVSCLP